MPVVVIAGLSSGVGKTHLIEKFLGVFPQTSVLKVTLGEEHTEPRIVTAPGELRVPGKDTRRYLDAGAGHVVWLSCRREDLPAFVGRACELLDPGLLLVESNSAIREIDPDVVVFIERGVRPGIAGRGSPKESAIQARAAADFITHEPFDNFDLIVDRIREVIQMSEDRARELVSERAKDNRLPCAQAFRIAEETGVPKARIGEILNEMNVKVVRCQLGCFS